jgi:hypothetical protein
MTALVTPAPTERRITQDIVQRAARGNIRGNIWIVRFVRIVRVTGRFGRAGAMRTDMTPELPG